MADIIDYSSTGHTIVKNGTADTTTSQFKIGTASCSFDGDSDYLSIADHNDWNFGSGAFTIEGFVRFNSVTGFSLFGQWVNANSFQQFYYRSANSNLYFISRLNSSVDLAYYRATWTPSINTWYHLAYVRDGSNFYMFVDGTALSITTEVAIGTNSMQDLSTDAIIARDTHNSTYLNGYIDELRVSKVARYTSNFTPTTTAFANDANTVLLLHFDSPGGASFKPKITLF